jgi:hypothetical protein
LFAATGASLAGLGGGAATLLPVGRSAEVAAALVFASGLWSRVRTSGLSEI